MVLNINRIFTGFCLSLFLIISYYLQFQIYLTLIIISLAVFEIFKLNIIKIHKLIFLVVLSSLFFFYTPNPFFLSAIFILSIVLFIIYNDYKVYSFILSIIFFLYFFFFIALNDSFYFYLIIFISFLNDTIAYFFGRLIKGPLIAPLISPNKTISGTFISFLISFFILINFEFNVFMSFLISISLFLGDIYFSYFKRINKIKDFSKILSSHGGIFDRIDSMIFSSFIIFMFINT